MFDSLNDVLLRNAVLNGFIKSKNPKALHNKIIHAHADDGKLHQSWYGQTNRSDTDTQAASQARRVKCVARQQFGGFNPQPSSYKTMKVSAILIYLSDCVISHEVVIAFLKVVATPTHAYLTLLRGMKYSYDSYVRLCQLNLQKHLRSKWYGGVG